MFVFLPCPASVSRFLGTSFAQGWRPVIALLWLIGFCGVTIAQTDKATTIHVVIVETHDRLTPTPKPGIIKRREFRVTLKANKQIDESWEQTDVTSRVHADPGGERSTSMGENNGRSVWHVLGNNKLQRISQMHEQLMIWNLEVTENKECKIEVKYLLKQGATFTTGKIAGTDTDATFTQAHVMSATCSIE